MAISFRIKRVSIYLSIWSIYLSIFWIKVVLCYGWAMQWTIIRQSIRSPCTCLYLTSWGPAIHYHSSSDQHIAMVRGWQKGMPWERLPGSGVRVRRSGGTGSWAADKRSRGWEKRAGSPAQSPMNRSLQDINIELDKGHWSGPPVACWPGLLHSDTRCSNPWATRGLM